MTDATPYAQTIRAWVAEGGRVVLLHQDSGRALTAELPDTDSQHAASMAWIRSPGHTILAGLSESQMRWWRPDHLVATKTFQKPTSGRFQVLLDSGGRYGMEWTSLAEVRVGKGLFVISQLHLADRIDVEPLAGELLARMVRYALTGTPPEARSLRLLAGRNEALKKTLASCSVVSKPGLTGDGPIMVDGSQELTAADVTSLHQYIDDGNTLWLHRFNPSSLAKVASLFPFVPKLMEFDKSTQAGKIINAAGISAGLSTFDLYWTRVDMGFRGDPYQNGQVTAKLGDYVLQLPTLEAGKPLTSPAFMIRVPTGKGSIFVDNLAWEDAYGAEPAKVSRLLSTLVTNLGGDVRLQTERDYKYFSVDLSPYVNMGYYDQTEGDSKGGWTDQGINDMRFFLINHTGRAGGVEGAAEVTGDKWPAEVRFGGRPFRLVDPTIGAHKGVISLRGGTHDMFLPGELKGIKVGRTAERLWFLHTACWAVTDKLNAEIGRYIIHYDDGSTVTVPLRYGLELQDWWDPAPLANSQVAWTGKNLKRSPIGIWITPWENPNPDKKITMIDLIGNLTESQIVLLGITGGTGEGGAADERQVAQWMLSDANAGSILNRVPGGANLTFDKNAPTIYRGEGHAGLRVTGGQSIQGEAIAMSALKLGGPFSLEMSIMVEKPPIGYMGGLFEFMKYQSAGFRLVYYQNMKLGAEIFPGPGKSSYIVGQTALQPGRFYHVRIQFDGQRAQLFLDGKLDAGVDTAAPAPCDTGVRIGTTGGNQYDLNGVVEEIVIRTPVGNAGK